MTQLRVAILSDGGSFYAPRLVAGLLASPDCSIRAVFVRTDGESRLRTLMRVIHQSGLRYSLNRAVALQKLRSRHSRARATLAPWTDLPLPDWQDALAGTQVHVEEIPTANSVSFRERLDSLDIDVLLSVFYGEIVCEATLSSTEIGAINVHPSLLPQLRGTNPVFWALAQGLDHTGLTAHEMVEGVDKGVVVGRVAVEILPGDSHHQLYSRIVERASPLLAQSIVSIASTGTITGTDQDNDQASYFSKPTSAAYAAMKANGHRFL